jgi:hypothetical protein
MYLVFQKKMIAVILGWMPYGLSSCASKYFLTRAQDLSDKKL